MVRLEVVFDQSTRFKAKGDQSSKLSKYLVELCRVLSLCKLKFDSCSKDVAL